MTTPKFIKIDLKQLGGLAFCGAPIGGPVSVDALGTPAFGEALSLSLVLGAFLAVGVWMFRRWGKTPDARAPTEISPEMSPDPRREGEPANA